MLALRADGVGPSQSIHDVLATHDGVGSHSEGGRPDAASRRDAVLNVGDNGASGSARPPARPRQDRAGGGLLGDTPVEEVVDDAREFSFGQLSARMVGDIDRIAPSDARCDRRPWSDIVTWRG